MLSPYNTYLIFTITQGDIGTITVIWVHEKIENLKVYEAKPEFEFRFSHICHYKNISIFILNFSETFEFI